MSRLTVYVCDGCGRRSDAELLAISVSHYEERTYRNAEICQKCFERIKVDWGKSAAMRGRKRARFAIFRPVADYFARYGYAPCE